MSIAPEEACVLAALAIEESGKEVTVDLLSKCLNEAKVQVNPEWPVVIAEYLRTNKILDLVSKFGTAGAAPAPTAAAEAPKEEEKKEETEEEIIAGFGFDDDDD